MPRAFESHAYFAAVVRASPDVVRILTLDGRVEYMNERGRELLEIENFEQNRNRLWSDLWPSESRRALRRVLTRARAGQTARFHAFCPTAKGKPRWWDTIVTPIHEDGRVVRLLATSRDITRDRRREERRRRAVAKAEAAERAQARSAAYLDEAVQAMPAGLAFYDADDRLMLWNAGYEQAGTRNHLRVGLTFTDLLRSVLAMGVHPEAVGREDEWLEERLAIRRSGQGAAEQLLDTGAWWRFEDRRLSDGGLVSIAVDITDLKRREAELEHIAADLRHAKVAAEAASHAKSEFLSNMSHELRTPLNGVVGMADLLARSNLSAGDREMVELIRSSSSSLQSLLADILDLARMESGLLQLEPAPFHLGDCVRSVAGLAQLQADAKGLRLAAEVQPEADWRFVGDALRVRQVLASLVSNAVKFTDAGEITITAAAMAGGVRLSVVDTGVGFDVARKAQIFAPFEQADGSITRRFGGSGLGLALSREIAGLMGATLDCDSAPGAGSRFWIDLPLAPADPPSAAAAPPQAADPGDVEALRILIADDHPTNRKVAELILGQLGADTAAACDGAEAVAAFKAETFDLVLMDMQMPVMDGLQAVREMRRLEVEAGRPRTPILMVTANAMPEHVSASLEAGADGHVPKPVTADRLLCAIAEVSDLAADAHAA